MVLIRHRDLVKQAARFILALVSLFEPFCMNPCRLNWLLIALALSHVALFAQETPTVLDDKGIAQAVRRNVQWQLPSQRVTVRSAEGVVSLSGTASSLSAKREMVKAAERVRGVRDVVDKIDLEPVARSDDEIKRDVEQALADRSAIDVSAIEVSVENGGVILAGILSSPQQKHLIAQVAADTRGVREVRNNISLHYEKKRADEEIRQAIEQRLHWDALTNSDTIQVTVTGGNVSLTGSISSAFEKSRAAHDAWIDGVVQVDASGLKVAPDAIARTNGQRVQDSELQRAIDAALIYDGRISGFSTKATVTDGKVVLRGVVPTLDAKFAAAEVAREIDSVRRVKNLLKVRGKTQPSDTELVQKIREAISRDPHLQRREIGVSVANGAVYLSGVVATSFERERAAKIASQIEGVIAVENRMAGAVSSRRYTANQFHRADMTDAEIKEEVEEHISWNAMLTGDKIKVAVDDATVILSGSVDSLSDRDAAEKSAWQTGALAVRNQLVINESPTAPGQ
jgi:osmotically-inducible protein OsmY